MLLLFDANSIFIALTKLRSPLKIGDHISKFKVTVRAWLYTYISGNHSHNDCHLFVNIWPRLMNLYIDFSLCCHMPPDIYHNYSGIRKSIESLVGTFDTFENAWASIGSLKKHNLWQRSFISVY